jgi:outer membrane protein TolC
MGLYFKMRVICFMAAAWLISCSAVFAQQTVTITLDEAIHRAEANEPIFAASVADSKVAALDRSIARAALLPNAVYHNQYLYTQGTGTTTPRFIANNAVHEYISQGVVNETVGLAGVAEVKRADAAAAFAAAQLEVTRRGLVATVVNLYYSLLAADQKQAVATRAADEADSFVDLTRKRENAREAAHADVIKAQLEQQQRHRDLEDARVAAERARLELGVLLFPDPRTPYTVENIAVRTDLPTRAEVQSAASANNPDIRSAFAALQQSSAEVLAARAAYLPDLRLNVTYGIDAPQFATRGPDGIHNLGYSAAVTLDIPVWDWLSTQHKVRQSEIRRDAARVALTAAQRRLIAELDEFYSEAVAARNQLASLDQSVQTATDSLRLTKLRYTDGEATVLEVVDAQNALTLAEIAREDGRVRYELALANLQTLTGKL